MGYMLDTWQNELSKHNELSKPGDGLEKLIKVLMSEEVELYHLAQKMKSNHQKQSIGLPKTHHKIPDLQKQSVTSTPSSVSDQGSPPICASHSVGKAVQEIIDDLGFNSVQQKIIDALQAEVQPLGQRANPNEFNNKSIKVDIEKDNPENKETVEIQIGVQTDWAVGDNYIFKTIPILSAEKLDEKKMKMVLRWDTGRKDGAHAIFAKEYDNSTGTYSCINSWGQDQPSPKIADSRIYAVDYITIVQM